MLEFVHTSVRHILNFSLLKRNLPGIIEFSHKVLPESGCHSVEMSASEPQNGEKKFDCRFEFNFADGHSSIKNFSIHNTRERGQGLGAKVIANLIDTMRVHKDLKEIKLTAELERGALVWLKMGWLPNAGAFTKLQKKCQPKLDALQQLLPSAYQLKPQIYGMFRDLLDSAATKDPAFAWAIVDAGASYDTEALKELQNVAKISDALLQGQEITQRAAANGITLSTAELHQTQKNLRFLTDLDLEGLSRNGKIPVAATLLAWETWKGTLSFDNQFQMNRLERCLVQARHTMHNLGHQPFLKTEAPHND